MLQKALISINVGQQSESPNNSVTRSVSAHLVLGFVSVNIQVIKLHNGTFGLYRIN